MLSHVTCVHIQQVTPTVWDASRKDFFRSSKLHSVFDVVHSGLKKGKKISTFCRHSDFLVPAEHFTKSHIIFSAKAADFNSLQYGPLQVLMQQGLVDSGTEAVWGTQAAPPPPTHPPVLCCAVLMIKQGNSRLLMQVLLPVSALSLAAGCKL